jgi:hypothetical protein
MLINKYVRVRTNRYVSFTYELLLLGQIEIDIIIRRNRNFIYVSFICNFIYELLLSGEIEIAVLLGEIEIEKIEVLLLFVRNI